MNGEIPERLARLPELAYNLLWTWRPEIRQLFARLDPDLWEETEHNPVRVIHDTDRIGEAAEDASFVDAYHRILRNYDEYMRSGGTWMQYAYPEVGGLIAYFSAEFGLHEALPIYSGGLGVLAGDHVKSASDLGVPLVGVGILYAQGYFRQRLDAEGTQHEVYEPFEPGLRPVQAATHPEGGEVVVSVELPERSLHLKVWRVEVGRASVLLLDADIPANSPEDRQLTARLYGGDNRTRIVQEIILGVGGMRALRAVGMHPEVCHLNEGHAAFCTLERVRELVAVGHTFGEAKGRIKATTVFTTHTPTPAGHDAFSPELFRKSLEGWPQALGTDGEGLWALGHQQEEWGPVFNMTVLAMTLSAGRNAVSGIHREVVAGMWEDFFDPDSIMYVTNGVHTWSWLSAPLAELFDRHSGGRCWRRTPEDTAVWSFVGEIPPEELWRTHTRIKCHTVEFLNRHLRTQRERNGSSVPDMDPEALTVGFARRFATYKRATLLLRDVERIQKITKDADRPVQFVFAGKAHPADTPGKDFIRELHRASENELCGHLFVLEDYDMSLTRRMVRGVDLWMNNPRPPLEASGTSGQKAALNGVPNLSVLDGWWPEAYNGENGWTIGFEKEYPTSEDQDAADADSLYETLEESIVPLFYDRDEKGIPQGWVGIMKESVSTVAPAFSAQRMVRDYVHRLYVPRMVNPVG